MALKLFCKSCKELIKTVSVKEMSGITGDEICNDCAKKVSSQLVNMHKIAAKAIEAIKSAEAYALVEINRVLKRVTPVEKKK